MCLSCLSRAHCRHTSALSVFRRVQRALLKDTTESLGDCWLKILFGVGGNGVSES